MACIITVKPLNHGYSVKYFSFILLVHPLRLEKSFVSCFFLPPELREKSLRMRRWCDSLVWETTGLEIKGNSFIIYQLPATARPHRDRPLKSAALMAVKFNFQVSSVDPSHQGPGLRGWLRFQFGQSTKGQETCHEGRMNDDWQVTDGVCLCPLLRAQWWWESEINISGIVSLSSMIQRSKSDLMFSSS